MSMPEYRSVNHLRMAATPHLKVTALPAADIWPIFKIENPEVTDSGSAAFDF